MTAQQGHLYQHGDRRVIALETSGGTLMVRELDPDGPRYKALGNSWAVPCARWVGERLAQHLARSAE